jgi:hypothetical protein
MADQPSPFAPFQPSPPTAPEPAANTEKPTRAKRRTKAEMDAIDKPFVEAPKKKPALKSHAPKFDLQTTLAAAKLLNEDDFPMFEKLVVMLDEAGKPQRDRVLSAIAKVFG